MGQSKAWLRINNEPCLTRIVRIVSSIVQPVVVGAARDQLLPELPSNVWIAHDSVADRGPLEGLVASLGLLGPQTRSVFVCACDNPLIQPKAIEYLIDRLGPYEAVVPCIRNHRQPLMAVYRVDALRREILARIGTENRSLREVVGSLETRILDESDLEAIDPGFVSFRSANTREEFEEILRIASSRSNSEIV